MQIIFLDTETTGLKDARLVQLAYKKLGEKSCVNEYFKPPVPIDIEAMAVHHITEKKVLNRPQFANSDTYIGLSGLLEQSVLVAHNAKFDISILANEGMTAGKYICTYKIAQHMYDLPNYKMQYLRYLWNIDIDGASAHDAEGDVVVLEQVFNYLLDEFSKKNDLSRDEAIEKFIEVSNTPQLLRRVNFGKHMGKTFEEIKKVDPSYLGWLASLSDKDEDFVYTVKYYLDNK